jgi:hypothetical protein
MLVGSILFVSYPLNFQILFNKRKVPLPVPSVIKTQKLLLSFPFYNPMSAIKESLCCHYSLSSSVRIVKKSYLFYLYRHIYQYAIQNYITNRNDGLFIAVAVKNKIERTLGFKDFLEMLLEFLTQ